MAIKRELKWVVAADGAVTPTVPLDGGAQGDHNQTRAIFEVAEGSAWADPANAVYIECDDGAGNVDTTEQLTVVDGKVSYLIPRAWTQYGGTVTLRLVAEGPGVGEVQAYSAEALARLDSRQNAMEKVDSMLKGRMAAAEKKVVGSAEAAVYAADSAVASASAASLSLQGAQLASTAANEAAEQAAASTVAAGAHASNAAQSAAAAKGYAEQAAQSGAVRVYEIDDCSFAFSDEDGNVAFQLSNEGEVDYKGKGEGGGTTVVTGDTAFDFRKCGLPVLDLKGDASAMTKEKNEVELEYKLTTRKAPFYNGGIIASGTCKCKWQGSSSVRNEYAKHNYTIKFDTAFEATAAVSKRSGDPADNQESEFGSKRERKWGEQKKYCLKANWIDPSGVRNVVNAKLWGDIVRSRTTSKVVSAAPDQLTTAPNCGAIDGFPCIIAINGEFEGLYTFNIPKDGWLFGMGESLTEYVVSGEENGKTACGFYAPATFVEDENEKVDFSVEYMHDDANEEDVIASFNNAINAVKNAPNSTEWESAVADYFDIDSAIDYYIFICCISAHDNLRRNTLYATYDGVKWFMSAYDLDTTYGYNPYGTCLFPVKTERTQFAEAATGNTKHRLFELIYKYSKDKLKARYTELRSTILSDENVWYMLANFANRIPRAIYNLDADKFADEPDYDKYPMPATATANVENYMHYYRMHCALLDKEMEG